MVGSRTAAGVAAILGVSLPAAPAPVGPPDPGQLHTERVTIGRSVEGRPIVAVHQWRTGASSRLVVIGSMHGTERAGMRVVRRLRESGPPDGVDLWTVRTMNPDGTHAGRRTNARGVDLNRNFPRFWRYDDAGTPKWSGPAPASEPETRAVQAFLRRVDPRTTVVVHQPLHGVDSYRAKSLRLVRRLARNTGLPVRRFDCFGGCHGTLTDWANGRLEGRAVTLELGPTASAAEVNRVASGVAATVRP